MGSADGLGCSVLEASMTHAVWAEAAPPDGGADVGAAPLGGCARLCMGPMLEAPGALDGGGVNLQRNNKPNQAEPEGAGREGLNAFQTTCRRGGGERGRRCGLSWQATHPLGIFAVACTKPRGKSVQTRAARRWAARDAG